MTQLFSNNATSVLTADINSAATIITLPLGDGALFNSPVDPDFELVTIHNSSYSYWEVVKVVSRSGDSLTISRGYEGVQQEWLAGSYVSANITAQTLTDIMASIDALNTAVGI